MPSPGPHDPELPPGPLPLTDGLAFPPAGEAPDPGPLARAAAGRQLASPVVMLPPPARLPTEHRSPARRRASSARRLALMIASLAIVGAGLTIAAREAAVNWRRPGDFLAAGIPTETYGPPPTPMAALTLKQFETTTDGAAVGATGGRAAWELRLRQLTFDGCCVGSWWSADSKSLRFVDRPEGSSQTAMYALPIWPPGELPVVFDGALAASEGEPRFSARPEGDISIVTDKETGLEWPVGTGGNPTLVAPDGGALAWYAATGGRSDVDGFNSFFASALDGTQERSMGGMWGGSLLRFMPDSEHVLALGRQVEGSAVYSLQRIALADGVAEEIAAGSWLSDVALSPGASWVAYMVSLDREQADANGIWLAPTEPKRGPPRKLELPGAYRWRDDNRLVYIPLLPGAPAHAVLQFDALLGKSSVLLDPADLPIRVAGNDWSVSPDGRHLAFRAEEDRCIWLLALPE